MEYSVRQERDISITLDRTAAAEEKKSTLVLQNEAATDNKNTSWCIKRVKTTLRVFENHKKVSFNIASEASYVYILSGQKFIKNAKNGLFLQVFENLKVSVKQCYQTGQF